MGAKLFEFAELVFEFGNTMWASLTKSVAELVGVNAYPDALAPILELTLAEVIIGAVVITVVYTLVKWVVGVVTGS